MIAKLSSAVLLIVSTACLPVSAGAPKACRPVRIAESAACVKEQLAKLRAAKGFQETTTVADDPDGMKTVTFLFEPKCLRAAVPCRIASRSVIAKVDCATAAATCP
jgi:hypothetical protein